MVTDAAAYDGARLREGPIDRANTPSSVWADTAYRSAANEAFLARAGSTNQIHRKKPKDRLMPVVARAKYDSVAQQTIFGKTTDMST